MYLPRISGMLLRPSDRADAAGLPSSSVEAEAAGALWALSYSHAENKVSIAGAGAIPQLTRLLGVSNETAQRHAASALASIAYGQPDNQEQIASLLVGLLSCR